MHNVMSVHSHIPSPEILNRI